MELGLPSESHKQVQVQRKLIEKMNVSIKQSINQSIILYLNTKSYHKNDLPRSRVKNYKGYAMLMRPNKAGTAVHGYCPGYMAVRMR